MLTMKLRASWTLGDAWAVSPGCKETTIDKLTPQFSELHRITLSISKKRGLTLIKVKTCLHNVWDP